MTECSMGAGWVEGPELSMTVGPTLVEVRMAALHAAARVRAGDAVNARDWLDGGSVLDLAKEFEAWLLAGSDRQTSPTVIRQVGQVIADRLYAEDGPLAGRDANDITVCMQASAELARQFLITPRAKR